MKTKIYKTLTLAIVVVAFSISANAQLPNFTKVDTGAITIRPGGHGSSTCFDMDNDGDLDLFIGNSAVNINRIFGIFKNERNGLYIEMPQFINTIDLKMLSSFGDIDNDGNVDLFAGLPYSTLKNFTNNGYGAFQLHASLYAPYTNLYPTLIDLNNDGYLDVVGIDKYGGVNYNDGNGGFLAHVNLGLFHEDENVFLHSVSWGDVDNDGDFDFYGGYSESGGDIPKNKCYLNDGNGAFVEFDPTSIIVEDTCNTLCVNWVDYDNDGDMDLYVHNPVCDNSLPALYENLGNMEFARHEIIDEIYRYSFASSGVWGDLDNDADLDLFITVENNVNPWTGDTSATPFNVLYLNEGDGQFTDILEHPLTLEDSHTAMLFDHDNDGDLDVLMSRYSWTNDGHCNLFVNEGNDNSWIVLTCEGTTSNRSAIGTRISAKCFVNGKHITQTREITPINGHLSYANLRVHFGIGDSEVIDTLIIRWPSGLVDTYLNVKANHFYRAIEGDKLGIDFKATNYVQYSPPISDVNFIFSGESINIDLNEHYQLIPGDTIPEITGDTLAYTTNVEDTNVVSASIEGSVLKLVAKTGYGETKINIIADAGFTSRIDQFNLLIDDIIVHPEDPHLNIFPNPFSNTITLEYELAKPSTIQITIYNQLGKQVEVIEQNQSTGKQQLVWNSEDLPSGIYYCVLKTESGMQTMKMIKLK